MTFSLFEKLQYCSVELKIIVDSLILILCHQQHERKIKYASKKVFNVAFIQKMMPKANLNRKKFVFLQESKMMWSKSNIILSHANLFFRFGRGLRSRFSKISYCKELPTRK